MKVRPSSIVFIPVLLAAVAPVARADFYSVGLFNNALYKQTSTTSPTVPQNFFVAFNALAQSSLDFDSVTVNYPPAAAQPLAQSGFSFVFSSNAIPTLTDVHTLYPFGNYGFNASKVTPLVSNSTHINYGADHFTSDIPAVTPATFTALQSMNAAQPLALNFNSFTPDSATTGLTFITIFDNSTSSLLYDPPALANTATSFLLPANKLLPGKSYKLEIDFTDRISGIDVNLLPNLQGFDVRTDITFTTAPVPEPTTLALLSLPAIPLLTRRRRLATSKP